MVWQPTMRVWAGDDVKVDEKELEGDAMEGIEGTLPTDKGKGTSRTDQSTPDD
jgi:histone-binding protein RBBP4